MSIILLIEKRLFLRNCLYDCFDRSYPDHEIVAFGSLTEWSDSAEKKTLNPAVVIYFAPAGIGLMMKSEFERLEALVPTTPIVVVSDTASSDEIARIIGYGARGYIPTSMPYHLAVEAVRFVEAGGTFVPVGNMLGRDRHKHIMRKLKVRNRTEIAIMTRRLLDETAEHEPGGKTGTFQDRPSL